MNEQRREEILNYYSTLGLKPGAGIDEIKHAFQEMMDLYCEDSPAIYGLFHGGELRSLRQKIERSYRLLLEQLEQVGAGVAETQTPAAEKTQKLAPRRKKISLDYDKQRIDGALLARVRQEQGLSLEQLSGETRIKRDYLRAIEAEDRGGFPARVYLAGFLKLLARALGLNEQRVSQRYLQTIFMDETKESESS